MKDERKAGNERGLEKAGNTRSTTELRSTWKKLQLISLRGGQIADFGFHERDYVG